MAKGKTIRIALRPSLGQVLDEGLIGFIYAHPMLQQGLILWEGVQAVEDGSVIACITKTTEEDVDLSSDTPLAMWDTTDEQDFEWADMLADEISTMVNLLKTKPSREEPITIVISSDSEEEKDGERAAKKQRSKSSQRNGSVASSHEAVAGPTSLQHAVQPSCNVAMAHNNAIVDGDEDVIITNGDDD